MSTNSPDAILGIDADDATPPNIFVTVIYHNGADTPTTWDKWPGQLSESQYNDLRDAAETGQVALNVAGALVFAGWYSTKPPGFKKAAREALLGGRWPR